MKLITQDDFCKDIELLNHNEMSMPDSIPFAELRVDSITKHPSWKVWKNIMDWLLPDKFKNKK